MIFDTLENNIFPVYQPGVGYIQNFVTVESSFISLTGISIHILACFVVNKGFFICNL